MDTPIVIFCILLALAIAKFIRIKYVERNEEKGNSGDDFGSWRALIDKEFNSN